MPFAWDHALQYEAKQVMNDSLDALFPPDLT
jgi:hypothetical protein